MSNDTTITFCTVRADQQNCHEVGTASVLLVPLLILFAVFMAGYRGKDWIDRKLTEVRERHAARRRMADEFREFRRVYDGKSEVSQVIEEAREKLRRFDQYVTPEEPE